MPEAFHSHIEPAVVSADRPTTIRIISNDAGAALRPGGCEVVVHPRRATGARLVLTAATGADGALAFTYSPTVPGECGVTVRYPGSPEVVAGSFYVADAEVAGLLPLRGDLHTHTWYSDGRSSPLGLLRRAVANGLDFVAVTDHNNYAGGAEALAAAGEVAGALTVLAGEEVTFERGHIVAVGARAGVAAGYSGAEAEIAAIAADQAGRPGVDVPLDQYARALWVTRRVRALGGLAFVAHPFWVWGGEYHLDWRVTAQLLRDGEADGVELLGEVDFEDNLLSIAGYMELLAEGVRTTVVGNSDTHGVGHTFGQYWSVVFARDGGAESVMEALRRRLSVACVRLPGEQLRIYGPLPLVRYAYYLHRAYFPRVDAAATALGSDYASIAAAKAGLRGLLLPR